MKGLREDEYQESIGISELHLAQMLTDPGLIEKVKAAQIAKQISRLRTKNKDDNHAKTISNLETHSSI